MLGIVLLIALWLELTFVPENVLPEETKCLLLLGRILYLLRSGDDVLSQLPLLQKLILDHHDLFVKLYPEEAKPKVHHLVHIPVLIARFGKNLSCFVQRASLCLSCRRMAPELPLTMMTATCPPKVSRSTRKNMLSTRKKRTRQSL